MAAGFSCASRIRSVVYTILLLCFCAKKGNGDLAGDADGLLLFKKSVDGNGVLDWDRNGNVCAWEGVSCTGKTASPLRVTSVRLPRRALTGRIPEMSIALLAELRVLSLHSNSLSGGLPNDLANCTFIRSLYLQHNSFSGPLHSDTASSWPNLLHLDLSFNNFSGSIPQSLGKLTQVKSLYLQNNSLSGSIPAFDIPSLGNFSVAYNRLEGAIPSTAMYHRLAEASFLGNNLCGFPLQPCEAESPRDREEGYSAASRDHHHRGLSAGIFAGLAIGLFFGLVCVLLLCVTVFKKENTKEASKTSKPASNGTVDASSSDPRVVAAFGPSTTSKMTYKNLVFLQDVEHKFDLEDLLRASAEVLGKGSMGTSYKAVLESGFVVVVKRLKDVTLERREFEKHMTDIGRLRHDNLVPLVAYFYSKDEKLLVTEHMANGSLASRIPSNKGISQTPLDWESRVCIAMEVARGIAYLHDNTCIHGNIKTSNILFNTNYRSCISDYGMAEPLSTSPATNRAIAYQAPEAVDLKQVTLKGDVYSYGMLLLELFTGRQPANSTKDGEGLDLPRWVQSVIKEEWRMPVFYEDLMKYRSTPQEEEMMQMLKIAMSCAAPSPIQRPSMKQVIELLEGIKKSPIDNQ